MKPAKRHLYLIGFMGSGKSAVGSVVARRLGWPFHDTDEIIVKMRGSTINTIFEQEGETAFRQYEAEALQTIVNGDAAVIALGGGAPTVPGMAEQVSATGYVVLLKADWQTVWSRVKEDSSRPLLADAISVHRDTEEAFTNFVKRADAILRPRLSHYSALADYTVDTSQLSTVAVAERVIGFARHVLPHRGGVA